MNSANLFNLHPMAWVHAQEILDQEMRMLRKGQGAKKRVRFLRDETNRVIRLANVTLIDAFQSLIADFSREELIHDVDVTRKRFEFYGFSGTLRSIRNAYRAIGLHDPGLDATLVPVAIQALSHDEQLMTLIQQTIESFADALMEQPEFAHVRPDFESILTAFQSVNPRNLTLPRTIVRTIAHIRSRLLDVEMTDILSLIVTHVGITALSNILRASRETQLRTYQHVLTAIIQTRLSELDALPIEPTPIQVQEPPPQPQESEPTLLTPSEAMKLLKISSTTLWRLRKSGALEFVNIRGCVRISRVSVEKYLNLSEGK